MREHPKLKTMTPFDIMLSLKNTKLFENIITKEYNYTYKGGRGFYSDYILLGTNFRYTPYCNIWKMAFNGGSNETVLSRVDFEYVLENVPEEIQIKLLFHLDLFV